MYESCLWYSAFALQTPMDPQKLTYKDDGLFERASYGLPCHFGLLLPSKTRLSFVTFVADAEPKGQPQRKG